MSKFKELVDFGNQIELEPPSLRAMVETHGGWDRVPEWAWDEYGQRLSEWKDRLVSGEIWRRKNAL